MTTQLASGHVLVVSLGKLGVPKDQGVRPLLANVAFVCFDFVPPVAIKDLIVAQESLEGNPISDVCLESVLSQDLIKLGTMCVVVLLLVLRGQLVLILLLQMAACPHVQVALVLMDRCRG